MTEKEQLETFGQIKIIVKLIQLPTFEDPSNARISKSEISLAANSNTPVKEENRYVFEEFFKKIKMDLIQSNYHINENPPDQTNQSNYFSIAEVSAAALVLLEKSNLAVRETTETLYRLIHGGNPQPNTQLVIAVALLINYLSERSNIDGIFKAKTQIHGLLTKKDVDHRYAYFLVSKLLKKQVLTETDLNSFFDDNNQVATWINNHLSSLQNFADHFYLTYSSKHSRDEFIKTNLYNSFLAR